MSEPLWSPGSAACAKAQISRYMSWLENERGLKFDGYNDLWQWSVDELEDFWQSVWGYFDVKSTTPYDSVLSDASMPGAKWFYGSRLNYASQVFRNATAKRPAIVYQSENTQLDEMSWAELERQVAALAATLKGLGVREGDRVVGYLSNRPEAVVAFLAATSLGAVWSLCAPDLGAQAAVDRFAQIEPKVLIAVDGYSYGGKQYDRSVIVGALAAAMPSVATVIALPIAGGAATATLTADVVKDAEILAWQDAVAGDHALDPVPVDFDHPLWIVYSSGTTGTPKAIVHGHGGVILEHLKTLHFHFDLGHDDRFFWYSSTAWMMWNIQIAGLLLGVTICTYDGNPGWPDLDRLWRFAEASGVTFFGAGAAYFDACRNAGLAPAKQSGLPNLRSVGSTGSPLSPESYRWIYDGIGSDTFLISVSGGTDFVSGFVGGVPILPVWEGELSCRCLGAAVCAFNDAGEEIVNEVGELVCTKPMPSMPVYFWNDSDGSRYRDSYFDVWPGVWRHGDWIMFTDRGTAVIYGRSDATINRHGVRMGTSELYNAVEALPEVLDSLVVDLEYLGRESYLPLFVVLRPGAQLDEALRKQIVAAVRQGLSPRHVPDDVFQVDDVPRTFSGKKLEIPIRRLLLGHDPDTVINKDTLGNPESIGFFVEFARRLGR